MSGMKVSVSLPGEDVEFLDLYAKEQGLDSRSAALQRAVRLLRVSELDASYESAWEEWGALGNAEAWDATTGDGLSGGGVPTGGVPGETLA
jgi:Arc/MetJ-type ribon-helix-helix transcriptional regulator